MLLLGEPGHMLECEGVFGIGGGRPRQFENEASVNMTAEPVRLTTMVSCGG